jgi:hypothetical protein
MTNTVTAQLALLLTPLFALWAFAKYKPSKAILIVMFGCVLFLPEKTSFQVPAAPPLDKQSIPLLCMLVGVLVTGRREIVAARPGRGIDLCIVGMLAGCVGTMLTNPESLRYGPTLLPGLTRSDLISDWVYTLLHVATPFLLGRLFFRDAADARALLSALVIAALVYTPFILIELRLSPQFHYWVYGFGQQTFVESKRGGGWRPVVFMRHGLALALFISAAALAAWALAKQRYRITRLPPGIIAAWLSALLAMMNSMGAFIYGAIAVPIAWLTKPKSQLRFALVVAILIALYPTLRITGVFPAQDLVDLSARHSQERAWSLAVRFANEDAFLHRALLKPLFGWGGWARGHVWNQEGKDDSILDGGWLAMLQRGFVELSLDACLLLLPVVMAFRKVDRVAKVDQPLLAGAAMVSVFYSLDLLPNGIFNRLPMFLAGALAGLAQGMDKTPAAPQNLREIVAKLLALKLIEQHSARDRAAPKAHT